MSIARRVSLGKRTIAGLLAAAVIGVVAPVAVTAAPAQANTIIGLCSGSTGNTNVYLPSAVPNGQYICAYGINSHVYDSRQHYFVIGTNHAIYHTWQTCVGCNSYASWTSLGGQGISSVYAVNTTVNGALSLVISVKGTTNLQYCKAYNVPPNFVGKWKPSQTTWDLCA